MGCSESKDNWPETNGDDLLIKESWRGSLLNLFDDEVLVKESNELQRLYPSSRSESNIEEDEMSDSMLVLSIQDPETMVDLTEIRLSHDLASHCTRIDPFKNLMEQRLERVRQIYESMISTKNNIGILNDTQNSSTLHGKTLTLRKTDGGGGGLISSSSSMNHVRLPSALQLALKLLFSLLDFVREDSCEAQQKSDFLKEVSPLLSNLPSLCLSNPLFDQMNHAKLLSINEHHHQQQQNNYNGTLGCRRGGEGQSWSSDELVLDSLRDFVYLASLPTNLIFQQGDGDDDEQNKDSKYNNLNQISIEQRTVAATSLLSLASARGRASDLLLAVKVLLGIGISRPKVRVPKYNKINNYSKKQVQEDQQQQKFTTTTSTVMNTPASGELFVEVDTGSLDPSSNHSVKPKLRRKGSNTPPLAMLESPVNSKRKMSKADMIKFGKLESKNSDSKMDPTSNGQDAENDEAYHDEVHHDAAIGSDKRTPSPLLITSPSSSSIQSGGNGPESANSTKNNLTLFHRMKAATSINHSESNVVAATSSSTTSGSSSSSSSSSGGALQNMINDETALINPTDNKMIKKGGNSKKLLNHSKNKPLPPEVLGEKDLILGNIALLDPGGGGGGGSSNSSSDDGNSALTTNELDGDAGFQWGKFSADPLHKSKMSISDPKMKVRKSGIHIQKNQKKAQQQEKGGVSSKNHHNIIHHSQVNEKEDSGDGGGGESELVLVDIMAPLTSISALNALKRLSETKPSLTHMKLSAKQTSSSSSSSTNTNTNNSMKNISSSSSMYDDVENCQVYTCGQNTYGELGYNDTSKKELQLIEGLNNGGGNGGSGSVSSLKDEPVCIAAGNEHTIILTKSGLVYTCGYNDNGQCGQGNLNKINGLKLIPGLSQNKETLLHKNHQNYLGSSHTAGGPGGGAVVKKVYAFNGCEHTMLLMTDGSVLSCGFNSRGQLGHGNNTSESIPKLVKGLEGKHVINISCSYYHSILSCMDGSVLSVGRNDFGQLGHGDTSDRKTPRLIDSLKGMRTTGLACGQYHTCITTTDGHVLTCGKNDYGQLGIDSSESQRLLVPVPLGNKQGSVVDVKCGYYHTLVLCHTSSDTPSSSSSSAAAAAASSNSRHVRVHVMGWGRNDYGQLGLGHAMQRVFGPQLVSDLEGHNCHMLAAGCYHSVVAAANGNIFVFGRNNHGQLGIGNTDEQHKPYHITKFQGKVVTMIAAGFYHTMILVGDENRGLKHTSSHYSSSNKSKYHKLLTSKGERNDDDDDSDRCNTMTDENEMETFSPEFLLSLPNLQLIKPPSRSQQRNVNMKMDEDDSVNLNPPLHSLKTETKLDDSILPSSSNELCETINRKIRNSLPLEDEVKNDDEEEEEEEEEESSLDGFVPGAPEEDCRSEPGSKATSPTITGSKGDGTDLPSILVGNNSSNSSSSSSSNKPRIPRPSSAPHTRSSSSSSSTLLNTHMDLKHRGGIVKEIEPVLSSSSSSSSSSSNVNGGVHRAVSAVQRSREDDDEDEDPLYILPKNNEEGHQKHVIKNIPNHHLVNKNGKISPSPPRKIDDPLCSNSSDKSGDNNDEHSDRGCMSPNDDNHSNSSLNHRKNNSSSSSSTTRLRELINKANARKDDLNQIETILDDLYSSRSDSADGYITILKTSYPSHPLVLASIGHCHVAGRGVIADKGIAEIFYKQVDVNSLELLANDFKNNSSQQQDHNDNDNNDDNDDNDDNGSHHTKLGSAHAQFHLGYMLQWGKGSCVKDVQTAVNWYRKSAIQGHANAQCNLGVCLYYGQGITMDEVEAASWFARSAAQGHAKAQCNLGVCFKKGRGVVKDDAKAVREQNKNKKIQKQIHTHTHEKKKKDENELISKFLCVCVCMLYVIAGVLYIECRAR